MRATKAHIGISTDGDADRFGIVDEDGTFFQPNYIIALAVRLPGREPRLEKWRRQISSHHQPDQCPGQTSQDPAARNSRRLQIHRRTNKGGQNRHRREESAGLSIRHHVPEKDGILAGLLCCEMVARRGKPLGAQLSQLFAEVGSFYPQRENFHLTPQVKETFTGKLQQEPREFFGRKVSEVVRTDGLKLVFEDGSWVCYRVSGTEPVVRAYCEASSKEALEKLSAAAKKWIFE